jgi:hypothetical protein
MIDTLLTLFLFVLGSLLVGRTVMLACGRREWSGTEPAVGYATMVAAGGLLARIPGQDITLVVALFVLAGVGLYSVFRLGPSVLPRSGGFWIASAISLAMVAIPFLVTGFWGLLGMGYNNDLGLHLAWTQWLAGGFGTEPGGGYPLGPHGLVAGLANLPLIDLGPAFIGQIMALPVLLTMTGYAATGSLAGWRRILASVLIGLPYLIASFYAQAAFKEIAMALFLLAFIILLPGTKPFPAGLRERISLVVPFAVLTLGAIFTFSFPGLAFAVAVVVVWLISDPDVRRRLRPRELLRTVSRPVVAISLVALLAVVSTLAFWSPFGFGDSFSEVSASPTFGPVSPVEALGVWLSPDYRLDSEIDTPLPGLMAVVGLLALVASIFWWAKRPRSPYPVSLVALVGFYLVSLPWVGDYSLAKALTIASPVAMVVILTALLDRPFPSRGLKAVGWGALATVFIGLALASSLLVLRDTAVGPSGRYAELDLIADRAGGSEVLFGDQDRFGPYYLPGSRVGVPLPEFPDETVTANPRKPFRGPFGESSIDFDSFDRETLQRYRFVLTTSAAWTSLAPPSFVEEARTPSWVLWRRESPAKFRAVMNEKAMAAKLVDCSGPGGRYYSELEGVATVKPETVVREKEDWSPDSTPKVGQRVATTVRLGRGEWRVSIQYSSPVDATLSAPGFRRDLIASLNGQRLANFPVGSIGQFWPAGVIDVKRSGPVEFEFEAGEPTFLQKLTGYSRRASLGRIALTRNEPHTRVPMSGICDKWVDFFEKRPAADSSRR